MTDYDSKIIRRKIRVSGSVQGVGFRYRMEYASSMVGTTGWVRNEPDGSVLLEIQGTEEQIDKVFIMVSQIIPPKQKTKSPHRIQKIYIRKKLFRKKL